MTDKPDWELAWERENPNAFGDRAADRKTGYEEGYLAASAQHEAAVAKAKREVLEDLAIRAADIAGSTNGDLTDGLHAAWKEARAKYSEPTAVAATEKEG